MISFQRFMSLNVTSCLERDKLIFKFYILKRALKYRRKRMGGAWCLDRAMEGQCLDILMKGLLSAAVREDIENSCSEIGSRL